MFSKKGLTLIEVLATISIISLLFIFLIPSVNSALERTKNLGIEKDLHSYDDSLRIVYLNNNRFSLEDINDFLERDLAFTDNLSERENPYNVTYELYHLDEHQVLIRTHNNKSDKKYFYLFMHLEDGELVSVFGESKENDFSSLDNQISDNQIGQPSVEETTTSFSFNPSFVLRDSAVEVVLSSDELSHIRSDEFFISSNSTRPSSGWLTMSSSSIPLGDRIGQVYIHYRIIDENGRIHYFSEVFTLEQTPPSISISELEYSDDASKVSTTINVVKGSLDIKDIEYAWSIQSTPPDNGWTSTSNGVVLLLDPPSDEQFLHVKVTDTYDNSFYEISGVFKPDTTNPLIHFGSDGNTDHAKSHSTTVNVSDNQTGISELLYIWSSSSSVPTSGWLSTTNGSTITKSDLNGIHYLHVKASDKANNSTIKTSEAFYFDNKNPNVSLSQNGNSTYKKTHSTNVVASDDHSGVKTVQYTWSTSKNVPSSAYVDLSGNTISNSSLNGTYYLFVKVTDQLGNTTTTISDAFNFDNTNPAISITSNGSNTGAKTHSAKINATDVSTISEVKYAWSNSPSGALANIATSNGATVTSTGTLDGNYYLHVSAKDIAGNVSNFISNAFKFESCLVTNPLSAGLFSYGVVADGIEIASYLGGDRSHVAIPCYIDGKPVVSLKNAIRSEDGIFYENQIQTVELPSTLKRIGDHAFHGNYITSVVIPKGVELIGKSAFANNGMDSLSISNSVLKIDDCAFCSNYLSNVVIPNSVTYIGMEAFTFNWIENLTLSNNLEHIGAYAFEGVLITELTLPASLTYIGDYAFQYANSLTKIINYSSIPDDELAYSFTSLPTIVKP